MGGENGENAAQDPHRLPRLPRRHPRAPCHEHGVGHWRATCAERRPRGSEEGCAEKDPPPGRHLAAQPILYSYGTDGELLGAVAVPGITSLTANQAGPADLLAYLRGHWAIEMHHYVRDVVPGEDASRIGRAHRAMAAVRNTVAGILHLHQVPNTAAQLRANHRDPYQLPLQFLGLMTPLAPNGNPAVT